jgi:hypothetical protein
MSKVSPNDDHSNRSDSTIGLLRTAGYLVLTASSIPEGLELLRRQEFDRGLTGRPIQDVTSASHSIGLEDNRVIPVVVVVADPDEAPTALLSIDRSLRSGIVPSARTQGSQFDAIGTDSFHHKRLAMSVDGGAAAADSPVQGPEAHATGRWARVIVPLLDSPKDPRTIRDWARWVAASPGTLRNWCRTARIPPRRSLVFGRMLRAVSLCDGGRYRPENLLDVVDLRTLSGLLRMAGLSGDRDFPKSVPEFLERQTLVRLPDALSEVKRALEEHTTMAPIAPARSA